MDVADAGHAGPVATVHVWRVPASAVPRTLVAVAADPRRLRGLPGLRFAKLLGTGQGRTFRPSDATLTRWMLVASWADVASARQAEQATVLRAWQGRAVETWHGTLSTLNAHGRWSRRVPFLPSAPRSWDGPVAVLTRARLSARRAVTFWRAVPDVVTDLRRQSGVGTAFGFGEAPVGVQGTFSVWRDAQAVRAFAYDGQAHRTVVRRTAEVGWYAEDLFARFALIDSVGTIAGHDPVAMCR